MTARSKFHIPSADEMKKDSTKAPEVKSIFKAFKAGEYSDSIPKTSTSNQSTNNFGQVNNAAQYRKVNSARPVSDHSKTVEVPSYKAQHGLSNTGSEKTEISATTTSTSSNQYKKDETKSLPGVSIVKEEKKDKVVITKAGPKNSITVNPRQRGNPILKSIRNVPWEFGEILPDYEMGKATCALFLSLRYHHLNPNYIHDRLRLLGSNYELRVLLVQVDVKDPNHSLKELAKICLLAECTLLLAWSAEEAGRYLETYKAYENKPPESIMERTENDFLSKMTDTLTSVKKVNKTDVTTFLTTFGSFENLVKANKEDLSLCPGVGPQKAQRLYDVFREPFLAAKKRKLQGKRGLDESPSPKKSVKGSPAKASPASKASLTASPAKSLYFKPS